jgi:myo-inositol-1(or 4)-monophosphatase
MWIKELDLAKKVVRKSGEYLLENWEITSISLSSVGKDIKLKGDHESEKIIINDLMQNSDYPILSEESGKSVNFEIDNNTIYWVIDPLDGSLNYHRNTPMACVSVGLWQGEKPILGAIYDFNRGELFSRIAGRKLMLNDHVVDTQQIPRRKEDSVIATGFPSGRSYDDASLISFVKMVQDYKKVRLLGSAALSLAWVAVGRFDVYSEEGIYLWDIAAGLALIDEDRIQLRRIVAGEYKYYVVAGKVL